MGKKKKSRSLCRKSQPALSQCDPAPVWRAVGKTCWLLNGCWKRATAFRKLPISSQKKRKNNNNNTIIIISRNLRAEAIQDEWWGRRNHSRTSTRMVCRRQRQANGIFILREGRSLTVTFILHYFYSIIILILFYKKYWRCVHSCGYIIFFSFLLSFILPLSIFLSIAILSLNCQLHSVPLLLDMTRVFCIYLYREYSNTRK